MATPIPRLFLAEWPFFDAVMTPAA